MTGTATRYLYLVRHGEAAPDENGLTEVGRRQAALLGHRVRDIPLAAVHHGPLPRARETARAVGDHLPNVPLRISEAAGDYVPYIPQREELPPASADFFLRFLADTTDEERTQGAALARQALELFTGPVAGTADRHELLVTHNFLVAWLVRDAMHAPKWRWLCLNHANAALTVIRYTPDRPATVLVSNDMRHLPAALRWTGVPAEPHI
ncbi:histidine phosphatase family protein [Streptomyces sp. SID14478]|uniref:histidine phosphatase family protein n=1 Tax=Streptomyces sp. SID14478 TaxID=2706073 RepID=UPI0013DC7000|nr:histidine phosphatase family protein [Streptomyces sp. SID14478]NEB76650.1 histidine phosphatase family protein [Streptomyces sp. SID14478]